MRGTRGRGDAGTRGAGDAGKGRRGEGGTGRCGEGEMRDAGNWRCGEGETRGRGDAGTREARRPRRSDPHRRISAFPHPRVSASPRPRIPASPHLRVPPSPPVPASPRPVGVLLCNVLKRPGSLLKEKTNWQQKTLFRRRALSSINSPTPSSKYVLITASTWYWPQFPAKCERIASGSWWAIA